MPNQLRFMDCPNCGKRVRTDASRCHHCQRPLLATSEKAIARQTPAFDQDTDADDNQSESHFAINGGYDAQNDDFDYEDYLAEEFPDASSARPSKTKPWVWVTAWVLIFAMLLPFFYYFLVN